MSHCTNIRRFSTSVYNFLSEIFSYDLNFSELGLTDHFVLELVRYARTTVSQNVEIYKTTWPIESRYGNDIDLFIQNPATGRYNWYALQAKVMSNNGAFEDISYKPAPIQQWDKLLDHEFTFGSKTFYLLYSGKSKRPPRNLPTRSDCIGVPLINELGLGIVETLAMKSIRETSLTPYAKVYFRHVFPDHIDSIRKLFCCTNQLPQTSKQFSKMDISTRGYQTIYKYTSNIEPLTEFRQIEDNELEQEAGSASVRIIISEKEI
jgi:hypothetical protein